MELNLPIYKLAGANAARVKLARAKSAQVSTDAISSVPEVNASSLENVMNSILSSGTISSLDEAYTLTGVANPNPYQEDTESVLNKSGYTVVNKQNCFKLSSDEYVEAVRMLYMSGMSISDIRKKLSSIKEGDILIVRCNKVRNKFSKISFKELLHSNKSIRMYKEYVSVIDGSTFVVSDEVTNGSSFDSLYILSCGQTDNDTAYLPCSNVTFPVNGTLTVVYDGVEYSTSINAQDKTSLLAQLSVLPITSTYDNYLSFSGDSNFYFIKTDICEQLGIKQALIDTKSSIDCGYSGAKVLTSSIMDEYELTVDYSSYPYNILLIKPTTSSGNYRKIYNAMLSSGVSSDICNNYLKGTSLYTSASTYLTRLKNCVELKGYEQISLINDDLFRSINIRCLSTTKDVIRRLLSLSDIDLEYLLRYRSDITGIDPYVSNDEALEAISTNLSNNSGGGTYFSPIEDDSSVWKQNTANARYIDSMVYLMDRDKSDGLEYDSYSYTEHYNNLSTYLSATTIYTTPTSASLSSTAYSDSSMGISFMSCCDLGASFNITTGLTAFASLFENIDISYLDDFKADMLIIQSYLDAGFAYFNGVTSKVSEMINMLNSSLSVMNSGFSAGVGAGSLLQCSLNLDIGLVLPPFLSNVSLVLKPFLAGLEAFIQSLIDIENSVLCPIQNLLDKYINGSISLPCKISYSIPTIDNIDAYLKQYINALNTLQGLCVVVKKDCNWLSYKANMMPGSMSLMVTNSTDCSET